MRSRTILVCVGFKGALVCRCVEEYIKDTKLDHVPDILSGRCVDDRIHQSYHEVVMSDSDIDKLVSLVGFFRIFILGHVSDCQNCF